MDSFNGIPIIDEETLQNPVLKDDIFNRSRGLVPRDYNEHPVEMFEPPQDMVVYPRSDWSEMIKEREAKGLTLKALRLRKGIRTLDQNGVGYCWGHSVVHSLMLTRARMNLPHVDLSAFHVCSVIKNGRDEGGWCGLACKFVAENGCAPQKLWPQHSRDLKLNTEQLRQAASQYRVLEQWYDLTRAVHSQYMTFDRVATCLLNMEPTVGDFNWWGHSVALLNLVEVERGSFGIAIWNSWSESWGDRGMGILRGSQAIPDGSIAMRSAVGAG
jgi:hypothetical protein